MIIIPGQYKIDKRISKCYMAQKNPDLLPGYAQENVEQSPFRFNKRLVIHYLPVWKPVGWESNGEFYK
jgi:hypothetical protein